MTAADMTSVEIPWGAWYQDTTLRLSFPAGTHVDLLSPCGGARLSPAEIAAALDQPTGTDDLEALAAGHESACIVVDDLARPTRAAEVLPAVLGKLKQAGISRERTDIVIATGSHGRLSAEEIRWKIGAEVADCFQVHNHDCSSRLAGTGVSYGDRELQVNETFLNAGLKIAIGSVLPHSFAGFSGGAKLVLPGLAGLASISRSHKFVQLGLRGGTDPNENGFRTEAEQIARQLGLAFVVCVVTNWARETIGVHAGDVVDAHRAACAQATRAFATPVESTYDCALLNAFPKDMDLVQASNSFVAWKTARQPIVREGGLVILATAASHGVGQHGLFDPDGVSYRAPGPLRHLRGRDLWILAPGLTSKDVHKIFWDGYPVFNDRADLEEALRRRLAPGSAIAVFPCAPTQQVDDRR